MKSTILTLFVALALGACVKNDGARNPNIYTVKANISELKNRTLSAKVRGHTVIVDQPKEFGADDLGPTPPEMLAIAYGSCVISTMQLLAMQRGLNIKDIFVAVAGDIDFSRALNKGDDNRAGFIGLDLEIKFKSDMTEEEKESFVSDVMKVGAAIDNVDNKTDVKYKIAK